MPAVTIAELVDAQLDVVSIEQTANGDDTTIVTSRLGETYNTVAKAVKALEDNGFTGTAMFADTTFGIAGTSDGQLFTIPGTTSPVSLKVYRNNAGVAVDTGKRIADALDLDTRVTQNADDIANISLIDVVLGETATIGDADTVVDISSFSYTLAPTAWLQIKTDWPCVIAAGAVTNTAVTVTFGASGTASSILFDLFLISND